MERPQAANGFESVVPLRFSVVQWIACAVGLDKPDDPVVWESGSALEAAEDHSQATLPPLLRRRVTALGKMAFKAAFDLSALEPARFIFCSRHGEFQRTLSILTTLATGEAVSPAEFSLSVHNALAGLLSIAQHNTGGHTAIAAGADFIKTSTGFSTGGATAEDVAMMRGVAGGRCGVKASGGIRTLADAKRMLEAGANRVGASASVAIVNELRAN